jgi:hypothetical protein
MPQILIIPRLGEGWAQFAGAFSLLLASVVIALSKFGAVGGVLSLGIGCVSVVAISAWNKGNSLVVVIPVPPSMSRSELDTAIRGVPSAEPVTVLVDTEDGPKEAFAARCRRRHARSAFAAIARLG